MLTERQLEIVLALVYEYIQTGEPVGSRTLSKKYLTDHSAATVRNEMADLEDLGYFTKPHSSAGRIPSAAAYRLYVDSILSRGRIAEPRYEELFQGLDLQLQGLDRRLKDISLFLSRLTRCFGVAALRVTEETVPLRIDLVYLAGGRGVALVVDSQGAVRHGPLTFSQQITPQELEEGAALLRAALVGRSWSEGVMRWRATREGRGPFDTQRWTALVEQLRPLMEDSRLVWDTSGLAGAYEMAASGQLEEPGRVMAFLEEPEGLEPLVTAAPGAGIAVTLGGENAPDALQDCAVVLAGGALEGRQAVLGLVGPLRMNYQKSIALLDALMALLTAQGKGS